MCSTNINPISIYNEPAVAADVVIVTAYSDNVCACGDHNDNDCA